MKMLVVDDSKAMRMIVVRELKRGGFDGDEIVQADSGMAALDLLGAGDFDFVVSDWNMPGMTGMELLSKLRANGSSVHFGFVTSESATSTQEDALKAGADFFVTKPFTGADLAQRIGNALGVVVAGGAEDHSHEAPTVVGVLQGLLGRAISVEKAAEPPNTLTARAAARYVSPATGEDVAMTIAELKLAAAAGAALSLIPAATATEWARAGALPANIEQNYHEVANVLATIFNARGERCALAELTFLTEGDRLPQSEKVAAAKQVALEISIEGYPSGRMGLVRF